MRALNRPTRLAFGAALLCGCFAAGIVVGQRREAALQDARRLTDQAGVAGSCQAALATLSDRPDRSQQLLEQRLIFAIDRAYDLTKTSRELDLPAPNLIAGVEKAREYALGRGLADTAAKCQAVIAFLRRGFAHA